MSEEYEREEQFKNKLFVSICKDVKAMNLPTIEEQIYEMMNLAWNAGISYHAGRTDPK